MCYSQMGGRDITTSEGTRIVALSITTATCPIYIWQANIVITKFCWNWIRKIWDTTIYIWQANIVITNFCWNWIRKIWDTAIYFPLKFSVNHRQWGSHTQSLDTDMQSIFIRRGHRQPLPMLRIRDENDGGHIIKRGLYIGIKRLCSHTIVCFIFYIVLQHYHYT